MQFFNLKNLLLKIWLKLTSIVKKKILSFIKDVIYLKFFKYKQCSLLVFLSIFVSIKKCVLIIKNNKRFIIIPNKYSKIFIISFFTIFFSFYKEIYTKNNKL